MNKEEFIIFLEYSLNEARHEAMSNGGLDSHTKGYFLGMIHAAHFFGVLTKDEVDWYNEIVLDFTNQSASPDVSINRNGRTTSYIIARELLDRLCFGQAIRVYADGKMVYAGYVKEWNAHGLDDYPVALVQPNGDCSVVELYLIHE